MSKKSIKIAASATVIVLALSGLMYTTLSEGTEYYKLVDEVVANPDHWQGKRINLHGFVVEKSIFKKTDTLEYRFQIENNGKIIPASFRGVVPDNFKDGAELVLKGSLGPHGFTADGMTAKCPSKYEESRKPTARGI